MAVRKFKPTTPGQRHKVIGVFKGTITATTPEKSLQSVSAPPVAATLQVTFQHDIVEAAIREKLRLIDFKRTNDGVPATVKSIEYDPNRSARIALLYYQDGSKAYIIAPQRA